jgi:hypothetical protein
MKKIFKKIKRIISLNLPAFHGYAEPLKNIADVFQKPLENFDKLSQQAKWRNRATQVRKGDSPIALIMKKGEWYFCRLKDKTLGWVHEKEVYKVCKVHKVCKVKEESLDKVVEKYLGASYLLGGTTEKGIDCSGLTQRIYKEVYGITLPKHSKDQAKLGKKVLDLNKLEKGDLVFFSALDNDVVRHVGLVLDAEKKEILHASEKAGNKVLVESLENLMRRYKISDVRRFLKEKIVQG